jgi:hypothetical protein
VFTLLVHLDYQIFNTNICCSYMNSIKQAGVSGGGRGGGTCKALPYKILLNLGQQSDANPEFLIRLTVGRLTLRLHIIYV